MAGGEEAREVPEDIALQLTSQQELRTSTETRSCTGLISSRDEMNLAEFPLAVLSTRVSSETKTLEFTDNIRLKNGTLLERKWIITGTDKFGLPTSTDDDVVLGLMCLTMDQGFRERKVYFTRYELMKILRWSPEGRNYSRLEKSLDRLSGVRIKAANAFFNNSLKAFQTRNFGIIDEYKINGKRSENANADEPKSYFVWSEVIFDSFKSGFIKKLDLDFYFSLRSAVSRRLYRFLDKHFYYKPVIEKPLMTLAFEKLGLSRNYRYVSSVKQQIEPAVEELIACGFLSSYEYTGRGEGTVIRFVSGKGSKQAALPERVPSQLQPDDELPRLLAALVQRGIGESQAQRLLRIKTKADYAKIWRIISHFDLLAEAREGSVLKNKVGYLYRAVQNHERYVLPEDRTKSISDARRRPELRVIDRENRTPQKPAEDDSATAARYKAWVEERLAAARTAAPDAALRAIRETVMQKLSCLRNVLGEERFDEAVQGCIDDELKKRAKIPPFDVWLKNRPAA